MASNPTVTAPTSAKILDRAFAAIQTTLEAQLSWLTTAYGKAERRVRMKDGREAFYPAVYANALDYLAVFPDSHLGEFCFFDVADGYRFDPFRFGSYSKIRAEFGIVFWFDFRNVYTSPTNWQERTNQHVITEVLAALRAFSTPSIHLQCNQVWERAENIYQGYTHREIDNQFLMRPYGGFRIDCEAYFNEDC